MGVSLDNDAPEIAGGLALRGVDNCFFGRLPTYSYTRASLPQHALDRLRMPIIVSS